MFGGVSIPGVWMGDRFVASAYGWRKLRVAKCREAKNRCQLQLAGCRGVAYIHSGELHHTGRHGRGMNGSHRDDRATVWTCRNCHERIERERTGARWSR